MTLIDAVVIIALSLVLCLVLKRISTVRRRKTLQKWTEASKGRKLILHGMYGNSDFLPTPSPFVLKLETFLRYANIPYELDKSDAWGPKGKTPWISFDGHHIGDSQFIVEYLKTKFDLPQANYTDREIGMSRMARIMVEEHLYWCGVMWRFAYGGRDTFRDVLDGKRTLFQWAVFKMIAPSVTSQAWSQGVGRHSESEVISLMLKDLQSLSTILGNNKFLLGDLPCEDDCSIFAALASAVFVPHSPVQNQLKGELRNLKDYCWRMRDKFWPDWDTAVCKNKK